ncbi:MAG TPA: 30S ribosome-binding factor RbfA [Phycisphaerae bacterium]|nr:30S ribosome-binding factor RbfA [Phycisphaerae bacterium]HPM24247.1 30S ribosome-binding factor RbfA [Phycisphaerae bacterium]HQL53750.1 30S ribosome-binding factor RbfA [Phycisphaerae bacterium]
MCEIGTLVSRRTERVGSLIRSLVAEIIQSQLADPRIPPITSITRVEVSDDFSVARLYVSVMAPDAQRQLCCAALQSASGLLRRRLAPELRLRKLPHLEFRLDDSVRRGFETVTAIDAAMREYGVRPAWEQDEADTTEADDEQPDDENVPKAAGRDVAQEDA